MSKRLSNSKFASRLSTYLRQEGSKSLILEYFTVVKNFRDCGKSSATTKSEIAERSMRETAEWLRKACLTAEIGMVTFVSVNLSLTVSAFSEACDRTH